MGVALHSSCDCHSYVLLPLAAHFYQASSVTRAGGGLGGSALTTNPGARTSLSGVFRKPIS